MQSTGLQVKITKGIFHCSKVFADEIYEASNIAILYPTHNTYCNTIIPIFIGSEILIKKIRKTLTSSISYIRHNCSITSLKC